ncbi:TPA: YSIRK-type signal peptide-containing protein, partial [Staphylococcus aureus]|nr:YSIRK-type signal peptide-containing protein [Staphylococcus aureus]
MNEFQITKRFSIRKFTVGIGSVLLGSFFLMESQAYGSELDSQKESQISFEVNDSISNQSDVKKTKID